MAMQQLEDLGALFVLRSGTLHMLHISGSLQLQLAPWLTGAMAFCLLLPGPRMCPLVQNESLALV